MRFKSKLEEAKFIKRYKRFFADIERQGPHQGEIIVAHVPNTGSLKSVNNSGQACLLSPADNPDRKLKFTLEAIRSPQGAWVGVNTGTPNIIVGEAVENGLFEHWQRFDCKQNEVKISNETRLDWVLWNRQINGPEKLTQANLPSKKSLHFIEIKNVTLAENGIAQFPDAVTERGQKHLRELMELIEQGHTAELVFTVQRDDVQSFAPADDIDPVYGQLLRQAIKAGLRVTPAVVKIDEQEARLTGQILPLKV